MHWLSWEPLSEPKFYVFLASGPKVKLASCKSVLTSAPPHPPATRHPLHPRWFTLLTVLRRWSRCCLTLCCFVLWGDLFCALPCVVLFLCFSILLALRLPRLGKRANLSAFRTFVRFVLVWICRFPLPLGVWEGLRFVIVALPGLFSYLF